MVSTQAVSDSFYEARYVEQIDHLIPPELPVVSQETFREWLVDHPYATHGLLAHFVELPSLTVHSKRLVAVYQKIPEGIRQRYTVWRQVPPQEKQYFITVTEIPHGLWNTMIEARRSTPEETIEVQRVTREISLELAVAIQRVWARMLIQTKYPRGYRSVMDGVFYDFSGFVLGLGLLHGQAHSPDSNLLLELISKGREIREFAANKELNEESLILGLHAFEKTIPEK